MMLRNDVQPVQNDDRSPPRDSCGGSPPNVANGLVIDQSFKDRFSRIGDTATYDCQEGFRMDGYKTVFCLSHETWSPLPVCERDLPLCNATPPHVPHAKATINRAANTKNDGTSAKVGDSATYVCDPGFVLDGHPVSYCLANGEWTPPPDCDELACSEPSVDKASVSYESLAIGSTAFFLCDEDYMLEGSATVSCLMNATWTPFPKCAGPIRCKWGGRVPSIDADKGDDKQIVTPDRHQRLPIGSLAIFTSLPIQCSGLIKKWNLWNAGAGSAVIYADVWRFSNGSTPTSQTQSSNEDYEQSDAIGDQFVLVGSNRLEVESPGSQTIEIEAGFQIFAETGDFVGIRYDRSTSQQSQASAVALMPGQGQQVLVSNAYPSTLMINTGYSFASTATYKSGIPLLSAVVEDMQELPYGPCVANKTKCPLNAECLARSCAGFGCVCSEGFWPNGNRTKCLRAVQLGEECTDDDVACIGYNVQCSTETGRCSCWDDWVPASDGRRCVRRLANAIEPQALLNETCAMDSPRTCYFGRFDQDCVMGSDSEYRCQCRSGYRPASAAERRAFPDDGFECRPAGFNLESSSRDSGCSSEEGSSAALMTSKAVGVQHFIERVINANASLLAVLAMLSFVAIAGTVIVFSLVRHHQRRDKKVRLFFAMPAVQTGPMHSLQQHPIAIIGKQAAAGVNNKENKSHINRTGY